MAASSPKVKVKKHRSIFSFMPKSGKSVSPPDKSEKTKKQISEDATPDETDSSSTIKVCRPNTIEGPERKKETKSSATEISTRLVKRLFLTPLDSAMIMRQML